MSDPNRKLVIGIPSVPRPHGYLEKTVRSVLRGLQGPHAATAELVVLNAASPEHHHEEVERLSREHQARIAQRQLVILEAGAPHPQLHALADYLARKPAYHTWMVKQTLDVATLMEACAARGELYLHLEDDVIASEDWFQRFHAWQQQHFRDDDTWTMLCLYSPHPWPDRQPYPLEKFYGALGLLFRSHDLPPLIAYMRRRCAEAPNDWLIRDYLTETHGKVFVHAPSLFQHVGVISSNTERLQLVEAPTFEEPWTQSQARHASELLTVLRLKPRRAASLLKARLVARIRQLSPRD